MKKRKSYYKFTNAKLRNEELNFTFRLKANINLHFQYAISSMQFDKNI